MGRSVAAGFIHVTMNKLEFVGLDGIHINASNQIVRDEPLYSVGTWDIDKQAYTPQRGLTVPAFNMTWRQLVIAVRELRKMGFEAHRRRDSDGSYDDNDPNVLIERTDGRYWKEIRRDWRR